MHPRILHASQSVQRPNILKARTGVGDNSGTLSSFASLLLPTSESSSSRLPLPAVSKAESSSSRLPLPAVSKAESSSSVPPVPAAAKSSSSVPPVPAVAKSSSSVPPVPAMAKADSFRSAQLVPPVSPTRLVGMTAAADPLGGTHMVHTAVQCPLNKLHVAQKLLLTGTASGTPPWSDAMPPSACRSSTRKLSMLCTRGLEPKWLR